MDAKFILKTNNFKVYKMVNLQTPSLRIACDPISNHAINFDKKTDRGLHEA